MPAQRRSKSIRQLRSQPQLTGVEEDWQPADSFSFQNFTSPARPDKPTKGKSPNNRKLRRQTMMPMKRATTAPAVAAGLVSPPLSLRRSRRQSMMPVKLMASPRNLQAKRNTRTKPASPDPQPRAKRKEPVEEPPASKKQRHIPVSKSSSQVKAAPSSPSPKKHKSLSLLPTSRKTGPKNASEKAKTPTQRRKSLPKKRALSPSPEKQPSTAKRRATSRSRSTSRLERRKSLPRGPRKAAKVPDKPPTPSPEKAVTQKKSIHAKASPATKKSVSPSKKPTTPRSKSASSALKTPAPKSSTKKSSASLKSPTSPASAKKTPKASSRRRLTSPKTQSSRKTSKTPPAKTPKTKTSKTPPAKTPKTKTSKTPPAKTPPSTTKTRKRTPAGTKDKSPAKTKTPKIKTPKTSSPRKPRMTRSAAKSRMLPTSRSTKRVMLNVQGKSPPSSLASFRKTPSSKHTAALSFPKDLGASPVLPSAQTQLQRIRVAISSATKSRRTPPRRTQPHTPSTPSLDTVITKADIHVSGNGKCGSEVPLDNHCDPWQISTPTPRPPIVPLTPKSSRGTPITLPRVRVSINRTTVEMRQVEQHTAPHSSTPIKGSHTLQDITSRPTLKEHPPTLPLSESMEEDSVDGEAADVSVDVEAETSLEENVEEKEEEDTSDEEETESTTPSRKSYCSLM